MPVGDFLWVLFWCTAWLLEECCFEFSWEDDVGNGDKSYHVAMSLGAQLKCSGVLNPCRVWHQERNSPCIRQQGALDFLPPCVV